MWTTARSLDADPNCRRVSRQCAEAATGRSGVCYVDQVVYDCGATQEITGIERTAELDCGGEIRCLGEDCVAIEPESSDDFDQAVAALHAAELVALDADCTSEGCAVFKGEALECKRAVGGIVNCCERPDGVSLGLYLQLMFSVAKLDSVTMSLGQGRCVQSRLRGLGDAALAAGRYLERGQGRLHLGGEQHHREHHGGDDRGGQAGPDRALQAGAAATDRPVDGPDLRAAGGQCAVHRRRRRRGGGGRRWHGGRQRGAQSRHHGGDPVGDVGLSDLLHRHDPDPADLGVHRG
ncbi:MAG: conjugal transfer protein TraN [Desulfomicrobium escambiense]|nr:conjugal transfer protein TraN [Desulfomicrobium escambiense]